MRLEMGIMKHLLQEIEEEYDWILYFLCDVGALEECEDHEGAYFEGLTELKDAKRILRNQIKSGEAGLREGQTLDDLMKLVKDVYYEYACASRCPICEEKFGPD
jgi:hypothetical protein